MACTGVAYHLVWSDEFEGDNLDLSSWSFDVGHGENGWGNAELQRYTSGENMYLQDSNLVIVARKNCQEYTSTRIHTLGKRSFSKGIIAARIKAPQGQGIWPAFWLLGESFATKSWPMCGEIDIFEMSGGEKSNVNGGDTVLHNTVHWSAAGMQPGEHVMYGTRTDIEAKLADDWHIYEVEFGEGAIIMRFDGRETFRMDIPSSETNSSLEAFSTQQPFFIILNLAVGGRFSGYPDNSTIFDQEYRIDWVRVFSR